jgi:hypothetical protein
MPSHPELGALGVAYTAMRAMQVVALITMIGLSGNFVSETVDAGYYAPAPLVGALVIVSILFSCGGERDNTLANR